MFADTALSNCLLLLASSSCIYLTVKQSNVKFFQFEPEIIAASIGVLVINLRSSFNLLSPLIFHASYSIDPIEIDDEEEETAELRVVPLHEKCCRVLSMSGLVYAICESHQNRKTGIYIVCTLAFAEIYHALHKSYPQHQRNELFHFLWMIAGGLFGWIKGNYFCLLAYLPYGMSFLALTPEKNCAWSARRIINNYMMMVHVFLMLEAIREAQSIGT